jgi:SsrA-binding protein
LQCQFPLKALFNENFVVLLNPMSNLITNKAAYYGFTILKTFEAGLVLTGAEVKSMKKGRANLKGSYIIFEPSKSGKDEEAFLVNTHISRYAPAGKQPDYDPDRPRKLLLNKKELRMLRGKANEKGLTILPLKVYTNRGFLKLTIGVAKGKSQRDKREAIKGKEIARTLHRAVKEQYR